MNRLKNITRYTYESTDFQGWRVSIQRRGRIITRYFSDLELGSEEASLEEALQYRNRILDGMTSHKNDLENYMDQELAEVQDFLKHKNDH